MERTERYLHNVSRLVDVLLEDHHGGGVDVDVVLTGQLFSASEPDVHIAKGQIVAVCEGG